MFVLGTAGHVDHGKSTLVHALTGINPDRWAEEQRREMTIDLGFAWLTLPSGRAVSLIDVPGHERFIKNMLAGVGGIDAALLVIAADEGMMPQTAEHLAILDLLGVSAGVVALTKADLAEPEWLALVADEVRTALERTTLAAAPIVPLSARTGAGLPQLLAALDAMLDTLPPRGTANGTPRLPIDRAFTIGGFGTVVTGTLLDGPLTLGLELEILPRGLRARVRGLQSHTQKLEIAQPGTRVAVNLSGVSHHDIQRGDLLTLPAVIRPTQVLDVQVRLVADLAQPLQQNDPLDLFVGAAETPCRVTLLDQDALRGGEVGWLQLRLERPVAVLRGDRYILRRPSPSQTIGGGIVLDPHPARHRRFRPEVSASLAALARGTPADLLRAALADGAPHAWDGVLAATGLSASLLRQAIGELLAAGAIIALEVSEGEGQSQGRSIRSSRSAPGTAPLAANASPVQGGAPERAAASDAPLPPCPPAPAAIFLITSSGWAALTAKLTAALSAYHQRYPLRAGMPREELRSRLKLSGAAFDAAVRMLPGLASSGTALRLASSGTALRLADFVPMPDAAQQRAVQSFLRAIAQQPSAPPPPDLAPELLNWIVETGQAVRVAEDVLFAPAVYAEMLGWVRATIATEGRVTVAQFRDRFSTSRKFALALLEHLDAQQITRRVGDARILA